MSSLFFAGLWLALLITNVHMYCKINKNGDLKWWIDLALTLWLGVISTMFLWGLVDYIKFIMKG